MPPARATGWWQPHQGGVEAGGGPSTLAGLWTGAGGPHGDAPRPYSPAILLWIKVVDSSFPKFCYVEGALLTPCAVPRFGRGITSGLLTFPSTQLFQTISAFQAIDLFSFLF